MTEYFPKAYEPFQENISVKVAYLVMQQSKPTGII